MSTRVAFSSLRETRSTRAPITIPALGEAGGWASKQIIVFFVSDPFGYAILRIVHGVRGNERGVDSRNGSRSDCREIPLEREMT